MKIYFSFLFGLFISLNRCGGSSQVDNNPLPVARGGQSVSTPASQYEDFSPALNSSGSKILFVSTRTQVGSTFPRRLWKSTFTSGTGASSPVRLLNSDRFDYEQDPVLSADGLSVLFTAKKDQLISLVLAKYDDPSSAQIVTSSFLFPPKYTFSADSLLFAYVVKATATQSILAVASVASPTNVMNFTVDGETISGLFWGSSQAGYQLSWVSSTAIFEKKVSSISFANLNAISSAVKQPWLSGIYFDNFLFGVNGTQVLLSSRVDPQGSKTVPVLGNVTTPTVFNKRNELQLFNFPASTATTFTNYNAISTRYRFVSQDGLSVFALGLFPLQCQGDANPNYQSIFSILNVATNSAETKIIPRTATAVNSWEIGNDPCNKKRADGQDGAFDFQMTELVVNSLGTSQNNVALYVTTQSGDQEVRAIETLLGSSKIYEVSSNKK